MKDDIDKQVADYERKLRLGYGTRSRRCSAEEQVERYRRWREEDSELVAKTREILDEVGISIVYYVYYYAYVRQVAKVARKYSDQVLACEAQSIIALWCARGLDQSVLDRIREDVLGIGEPELP